MQAPKDSETVDSWLHLQVWPPNPVRWPAQGPCWKVTGPDSHPVQTLTAQFFSLVFTAKEALPNPELLACLLWPCPVLLNVSPACCAHRPLPSCLWICQPSAELRAEDEKGRLHLRTKSQVRPETASEASLPRTQGRWGKRKHTELSSWLYAKTWVAGRKMPHFL